MMLKKTTLATTTMAGCMRSGTVSNHALTHLAGEKAHWQGWLKQFNHIRFALMPAGVAILSGCVAGNHQAPVVYQPTPSRAVARYSAAFAQIHVGQARAANRSHEKKHIAGTIQIFDRVVRHLQALRYLPITHAFIHGPNGTKIRHDAFLWPVPAVLQKAADQYAWNAQNPFIRGAVIQFERANGLLGPKGVSEGRLHKAVLKRLFSTRAKLNPYPFQWVYVTKASGTPKPEKLRLWEHEKGWIWSTLVNTGVLGTTPNGTWPIYQRLPSTTMRGEFPVPVSSLVYAALKGQQVPQWTGSTLDQPARGMVNGHPVLWQPYNDPGIKWVNYFDDGRGIHYYPRAAYGFPQSAGCVEEPLKSARIAYGLLHYGVPVTVSKADFHAARGV